MYSYLAYARNAGYTEALKVVIGYVNINILMTFQVHCNFCTGTSTAKS